MTRIELAGLMLGLLVVSVAGGISWRLFRPHRGEHIRGLVSEPGPNFYPNYPPGMGSMILEEETRLRGDWQDAYVRELAPETLDSEDDGAGFWHHDWDARPDLDSPGPVPSDLDQCSIDPRMEEPGAVPGNSEGTTGPGADLISMMSDDDFFHMARFEFRRLEWMASEPLTLPAWTGRAA